MTGATVLNVAHRARRIFDPALEADQDELRHYLAHSHWRNGCPFLLEKGYAEIPYQCLVKWAKHSLNTERV